MKQRAFLRKGGGPVRVAMGDSILGGVAIGPLRFYRRRKNTLAEVSSDLTAAEEWDRFEQAREKSLEQLSALYEKALEQVGETDAAIFEIHQVMLGDENYLDSVRSILETQGVTAERAAAVTGDNLGAVFADMDDSYMKARSADVQDISRRVVNNLIGAGEEDLPWEEPSILVAEDLTPSETVRMDRSRLLGFITHHGSAHSHAAILARTMNIPALVGVEVDERWEGHLAVLDGHNGCVYVDPAPELLEAMAARQQGDRKRDSLLSGLKRKPNVTLDGASVEICANIGSIGDVGLALENDAGGIGLLRSEFLYLDAAEAPSESEQFAVYRRAAETLAGKKVVIRTLDLGADKQAACFPSEHEANPALGMRGIRFCLEHRDIFKEQLRAILRASAYGTVAVMFPMVTSVREVRDAKEVLEECREELLQRGTVLGEIEVGIMVETPAAALIAEELAPEVDFFSLGTNDLTQYVLAIDRQNPKLAPFYNAQHAAVMQLIRLTVEAGHRHGCWVGICGDLGADPTLAEAFLRMGVDELSVPPAAVLPLRQKIRGMDLSQKKG